MCSKLTKGSERIIFIGAINFFSYIGNQHWYRRLLLIAKDQYYADKLTRITPDKSFQYFLSKGCVFLTDCLDQTLGFLGLEISMMFIDINSQDKSLAIALGVKLRGVDIITDTKHLYRTGLPAH